MFLSADYLVKINPNSGKVAKDLDYFKFVGRLIGYAMLQRQTVNFRLIPAYYKLLLGKPLDYRDLQSFDREVYGSIEKVVTENVTDWGLTFEVDIEIDGFTKTVELIEGGKDKNVNQKNKKEFVG